MTRCIGVLLLAAMAGCGDSPAQPASPPPNNAPVSSGSPPALTVTVGQTEAVNVTGYFTDPDGDALTYSAASSNAATASVSLSGSVVNVTAAAQGMATVTVTARDPGGLSAQATFTVTVPNQGPVAAGAVPARTLFVGDVATVDMSAHFTDPDGDALAYSATSSNAAVVSASVSGSVVSVGAVTQGEATVTVTARDSGGLSVQNGFVVTVPNRAPTAVGTVPAQTLFVEEMVSVDVSTHFTDADGDSLAYSVASSNAAVVSATVAGSIVSVGAVTQGEVTVTVVARDPGGLQAELTFDVMVSKRSSWRVIDIVNEWDDVVSKGVVSASVKSIRPMDFPYEDVKARIIYRCSNGNLWIRFTALNIAASGPPYDQHHLTYRVDGRRGVFLVYESDNDLIAADPSKIRAEITSGASNFGISLNWYRQGSVAFEWDLYDAVGAINEACSTASHTDTHDLDLERDLSLMKFPNN